MSENSRPMLVDMLWSRLTSIATEQATNIIRTSFSPIVREASDVATAIFDQEGRMIVHGTIGTPGHIVPMAETMRYFLERFPAATMRDGDVFITNDPWRSSGHLFDVTLATPIFLSDVLIGFVASTTHLIDIGGIGYSTAAPDVYAEGLFLPPLRFATADGVDTALDAIIRSNVREPQIVSDDLQAQLASNQSAATAVASLVAEYKLSDLSICEHIFTASERATRRAIEQIPDGQYTITVPLDGDDMPVDISLAITVTGDRLIADYAGSSPQSRRGINVCLSYTAGFTVFALRCAIARDVPNNYGSLKPFEVVAPEASIVNAAFPAPVSARHVVGQMLPGVVLQALAKAVPNEVMADGAGAIWSLSAHGVSAAGRPFLSAMFLSGGMGARPGCDGLTTTQYPTGTSCIPIEIAEASAPIHFLRKEIACDTGGPGEWRGGLGQNVDIEVNANGGRVDLIVLGDRVRFAPRGICGGCDGGNGALTDGQGKAMLAKARFSINDRERYTLTLPGGGGYGSPLARAPDMVAADVRSGYVSAEAAKRDYGVILDQDLCVDQQATEAARQRLSSAAA